MALPTSGEEVRWTDRAGVARVAYVVGPHPFNTTAVVVAYQDDSDDEIGLVIVSYDDLKTKVGAIIDKPTRPIVTPRPKVDPKNPSIRGR